MFLRALLILVVVASASIALSIAFGAEVLAALGMIVTQIKIVFARILSLSYRHVFFWMKVQGLNFAQVEIAKRWFIKSLIPMLIGAANQRRIAAFAARYMAYARARYTAMMTWYSELSRPLKVVLILIAMFAMLGLAVSSISVWLLLFSVQIPLWIIAALTALWGMVWRSVQKLVFRTLAFMQIYRVWGFLRARLPEAYLRRLRRFNFRVARIVVKRRKLTVDQLHTSKNSLALRWALLREYFRHSRPAGPTKAEFKAHRAEHEAEAKAEAMAAPEAPEPVPYPQREPAE